MVSGCTTAICSDYLSTVGCTGRAREMHHGIDFPGNAGTEVVSATYGTVVRKTFSECAGHGLVVRTDIVARHGELEAPVYAVYAHVQPLAELATSQQLRPGEPIGRIIPLRFTRCYGTREHVHYELRVGNSAQRHIDPHQFWADGPGKLSCFAPGKPVPAGKTIAPVRC